MNSPGVWPMFRSINFMNLNLNMLAICEVLPKNQDNKTKVTEV
jgi:hypothetical protein